MFLRKEKRKGRIYLSIVQGYREKGTGKSKQKTIETLGYLDELEKIYPNPIAHFLEVAKRMSDEYNDIHKPISIEIFPDQKLASGDNLVKNFGYAALSKIYHELSLDSFFQSRQRNLNIKFNLNSVFKLLVYARVILPCSKKSTFENKDRFFDRTEFSIDDVYRALTYFSDYEKELQKWIHERIVRNYGRDTSVLYYDVTNYYFEIDKQDNIRKKGASKEHRPDPIIQMGLFIDNNGLPVSYDLFPGNTNDVLTLRPALKNAKKELGTDKIIIVADKGINSGDNIYYALSGKNGYVISMSIRGANQEVKDFVLDENGYINKGDDYKFKSRCCPREIKVSLLSGKKKSIHIDEKQVVFYSEKYAKRAKAEREAILSKSHDLIVSPGKYTKATSYGAAKYVKHLEYDKKTGEILESKSLLEINQDLIDEESKFDGYYLIVTSEMEKTSEEIIDIYRGLWKIEESFKITKSNLTARPVYVSSENHICAHFMTCFVALTILRILEMKIGRKYSVNQIVESIRKSNYTHIEQNYYALGYFDDVLKTLGDATSIDFSLKYRTLSEIKKNTGNSIVRKQNTTTN